MNYRLEELRNFLLETDIPKVTERPLTFLGISKQPHYENVWSNIYAFFFDIKAEHNLKDLFIQSLLELINKNTGERFHFKSLFEINREYPTNNNGRIDILLSNEKEAIIIENKVYHNLDNDLQDYWNSVEQEKKQGVILSLRKMNKSQINHSKFIGISHLDFLECVINNLPKYFSNVNEKYMIFLKDFYQNIINITKPMDKKIINFFYENQEKINRIKAVRDDYIRYIISEVEQARLGINEELQSYANRNEEFRYYLCPNEGNLMITIYFADLFTEKKELLLIVEIQNELLEQKEKIKNIEFNDKEKPYIKEDFYKSNGSWAHFAFEIVKPTDEDLLKLGGFISNTINNSTILDIYRKLKKVLVNNVDE
jgi:hypothetical protein